MTAQLERGSLLVGGCELLARALHNATLRTGVGDAAPGAAAPSSRHVFSIGTLARGWRWLSLLRFKIWWMVPTTGADAASVPAETQMLLLETRKAASAAAEDAVYALMLPVLDGAFRPASKGAPRTSFNSASRLDFEVILRCRRWKQLMRFSSTQGTTLSSL